MTIKEATKTVMALIGEDDFHHIEDMLPTYYLMAQTQIATSVIPIKRSAQVECGVKVTLPSDLYKLTGCDREYTKSGVNEIILEGDGQAVIYYNAYPSPITDDNAELETAPETHAAIPYYAAAQAVIADSDMRRYYAFMDIYNNILTNASASRTASSVITVVRTEDM